MSSALTESGRVAALHRTVMRRLSVAAICLMLAASGLVAAAPPVAPRPAAAPTRAHAPAAASPRARAAARAAANAALAHEREVLDGEVAASLVTALTEQLDGRPVKIRLDHVDVAASGMRERLVRGEGQLQIEGTNDWLGFRFSTLYDSYLESAGYPELSIGDAGPGGRVVPNDARLIRELEDRVLDRIAGEYARKNARLQLDRIDTLQTGDRYLRIDAQGIADFGLDGTAPTRVEGLYDRIRNEWLRVTYALEGGLHASPRPAQVGGAH